MNREKGEVSATTNGSYINAGREIPDHSGLKSNISRILRNKVNFIRVAPVQHLTALINLGIMDFSGHQAANELAEVNYGSGIFWGANLLASFTILAASEWVAVNNLSKYERLKKDLERFGWDERLIQPHIRTWCGRHIARIAAIDCGFKNKVNEYYSEKGYQWYHFSPSRK